MTLWAKIKERFDIFTTNDRLDAVWALLRDNTAELVRLRKKVQKTPRTYGQVQRQRSEYRYPQRHH